MIACVENVGRNSELTAGQAATAAHTFEVAIIKQNKLPAKPVIMNATQLSGQWDFKMYW